MSPTGGLAAQLLQGAVDLLFGEADVANLGHVLLAVIEYPAHELGVEALEFGLGDKIQISGRR